MTSSADLAPHRAGVRGGDPALRVLFRAPAGARRGYGHLVRCLALARALGVRPLTALRGSRHATDVALALGADLVASPSRRALRALAPDVVVIDDPVARDARRWIAAARRAGAVVVTIHDRGIGCPEGDLVIDGSAAGAARGSKARCSLAGTRFAVLDPQLRQYKFLNALQSRKRVLIALGGGPHARIAEAIARAIVAADPDAEVRIASGFVAPPRTPEPRVQWIAARQGLAPELAGADVAVVGGGVSLYEACAMGVPAVAVPVVRAQAPTVHAFARRGAAIAVQSRSGVRAAAASAVRLLNDPKQRASLARRSMRLVDGRGAVRAAAAVAALTQRGCAVTKESAPALAAGQRPADSSRTNALQQTLVEKTGSEAFVLLRV